MMIVYTFLIKLIQVSNRSTVKAILKKIYEEKKNEEKGLIPVALPLIKGSWIGRSSSLTVSMEKVRILNELNKNPGLGVQTTVVHWQAREGEGEDKTLQSKTVTTRCSCFFKISENYMLNLQFFSPQHSLPLSSNAMYNEEIRVLLSSL